MNSSIINYYIKNFITSTHTLQINDGRLIPIVIPTENQAKVIIALVDQILAAKKADPTADTSGWEREIDTLMYQLYGLTPEEIAIVEGG